MHKKMSCRCNDDFVFPRTLYPSSHFDSLLSRDVPTLLQYLSNKFYKYKYIMKIYIDEKKTY